MGRDSPAYHPSPIIVISSPSLLGLFLLLFCLEVLSDNFLEVSQLHEQPRTIETI